MDLRQRRPPIPFSCRPVPSEITWLTFQQQKRFDRIITRKCGEGVIRWNTPNNSELLCGWTEITSGKDGRSKALGWMPRKKKEKKKEARWQEENTSIAIRFRGYCSPILEVRTPVICV